MKLHEGGNVFKDKDGQAETQRINQTDVKTTIAWLERLTGLPLQDMTLGSTGRKPTSGDLDLAVDANEVSKEDLVQRLTAWLTGNKLQPAQWVKKSGISVHFKTPINGNPKNGFVQTDFMFLKNVPFSKFVLSAPANSRYRGQDRNILINSIAKSLGYKLNQNAGIMTRDTNELISDDPDKIAKMLLNPGASSKDLESVETIIAALERDPNRDAKLADARTHFSREGIPFVESIEPDNEVSWLARLRDRIVNKGYQPLIEQRLTEAEARIPHLEDLVFDAGTKGVAQALKVIAEAAKDTAAKVSVKWDGKPAIIFGRKPNGDFVLTDKSGFTAKGYDGLATSPKQIAQIMQMRGGDRAELIGMYTKLFPVLRSSVPQGFRGYVQGDLLYTDTPPEVAGAYEFQPNLIKYRIPVASDLGQRIGNSDAGIAIHTYYEDRDSQPQSLRTNPFKSQPGLLLVTPYVDNIQTVKPKAEMVRSVKELLTKHGSQIDQLFNPNELRAARITDLPSLCKRYVNSRIFSNFNNLLEGFNSWLQQNVTPSKYNNIMEYLQSPSTNATALAAAFSIFTLLHDIKMDMLQQLDRQQPGQEGWVFAGDAGRAKLVNRFGFSAANRLLNNPPQS
jgi:hypothetical protein